MSDDFFDKIETQLGEERSARTAAAEDKEKSALFTDEVIKRMRPKAVEYAEKLKERGLDAELSGEDRYIALKLRYADGDNVEISFYTDYKTGKLLITKYYRDDKGPYSTSEGPYGEDQWKDDYFEAKLKQFITEFMSAAARHGGASKK